MAARVIPDKLMNDLFIKLHSKRERNHLITGYYATDLESKELWEKQKNK